jgi:ketosteroid isomerase-like protein
VRQVFAQLGAGDYESSLAQFPPTLHHFFPGDHALGGTRRTPDGMRRWFERLYAIFPGLHFEIRGVLVRGWPWRTTIAIEWIDRATLPDGSHYENEGVHIMQMRWGRVVAFRPYLDTQLVAAACDHAARAGVSAATASPIEEASLPGGVKTMLAERKTT